MPRTEVYPNRNDQEWPLVFPAYMRPPLAAKYLGHSESTLAKLRMRSNRDRGPRFAKLGGVVVYRRTDLDAWLDEHMVGGNG